MSVGRNIPGTECRMHCMPDAEYMPNAVYAGSICRMLSMHSATQIINNISCESVLVRSSRIPQIGDKFAECANTMPDSQYALRDSNHK